jgi:hypothetical protein
MSATRASLTAREGACAPPKDLPKSPLFLKFGHYWREVGFDNRRRWFIL